MNIVTKLQNEIESLQCLIADESARGGDVWAMVEELMDLEEQLELLLED